MKKLKDYKDEIHKCSKCGMCQAVCPVYQSTKNECSVTRGQFIMLDGVIKNKLDLNEKVIKHIDTCVKCNKCKEFCPSNIDVIDILMSAKAQYIDNHFSGFFIKLFESKFIFNTIINFISFFTHIFIKKKQSEKFDKKCIYFGGCINKLFPSTDNYVTEILNKTGIETQDIDFNCCGMLFLSTGNLERFKEQAIENINKIPDNTEIIVTDCASCAWAWQQYHKYIDDQSLLDKLNKIEFKSIYDLIKENNIKFTAKKNLRVNYHKPCHESSDDNVVNIIKSCENIEYSELENYNSCCGFAGLEAPNTLKTTGNIIKKKADTVMASRVDYTLTSCAGCSIAISISTLFKRPVRRLITFLKDNCNIK